MPATTPGKQPQHTLTLCVPAVLSYITQPTDALENAVTAAIASLDLEQKRMLSKLGSFGPSTDDAYAAWFLALLQVSCSPLSGSQAEAADRL